VVLVSSEAFGKSGLTTLLSAPLDVSGLYLLWSHDTALNFMRTYEVFGEDSEHIRNLDLPLGAFYKLAAPSTPAEIRAEALKRAATIACFKRCTVPIPRRTARAVFNMPVPAASILRA
jgi:hypothetical protein